MGAYGDQEEAARPGVKGLAYLLDRDIRMYILEVWG
jgi:hypothetical protein